MKRFILIPMMSAFICAISFASPETSDCVIVKSFKADKNTKLSIENRYGTITIINSAIDSVNICGIVTIDHPNAQIAQRSLSLVKTEINTRGNDISIVTSFDERFFSSSFSSGRKSFQVNYIIKAPVYINLDIINSFGGVMLEKISGSVNISLSHGNLTTGRLLRGNIKPLNSIVLRHSRAKIPDANWLIIESYHSPSVDIESCQALSVISEFSTINIGRVNSLVFSSKSDLYSIMKVTNCISETWLTKVKIADIADVLRATANMSAFRIDKLQTGFTELELIGNNTIFTIVCDGSNSFFLSAKSENAVITLPKSHSGDIHRVAETTGRFSLSGIVGTDQKTESRINAVLSQGKLELLTLSGK